MLDRFSCVGGFYFGLITPFLGGRALVLPASLGRASMVFLCEEMDCGR